ncbi:MAG TPA: DoxX family protein [Bryobacteraceae bacterium]|nr:DoxX family protein [Bryobacteraceae bacterium]
MNANAVTSLTATKTSELSMGRVRTGWIITGLIAAFMLFDVVGKFAKPAAVIEAFARTGWPVELAALIGAILLTCTVLYVIPRSSSLGAVLLTGYLGGAVATNLRLENPLFTNTLFPVYFGILIWVALLLREPRIGKVFPLLK